MVAETVYGRQETLLGSNPALQLTNSGNIIIQSHSGSMQTGHGVGPNQIVDIKRNDVEKQADSGAVIVFWGARRGDIGKFT